MTTVRRIPMVDLAGQYQRLRPEIDAAIADTLASAAFIRGPQVRMFEDELAGYLGVEHVIGVGNGTDALQLALMACDLRPGDEIIVPAFTFIATAEVAALLGMRPVMVDVDPDTFMLSAESIAPAITPHTRAIIAVHLFGQSCDMAPILELAGEHGLYVIEDNAQAIGACYTFPDGTTKKAGTMGVIGCTSFFPSKNLGCYGDGGACFTDDDRLAERIRILANHGMKRRYYHDMVGVNSRLDSLQAAVLRVKLKYLDQFNAARLQAADWYDSFLGHLPQVATPQRAPMSTHVFHQYTLKVPTADRDGLVDYLKSRGVDCNIYYPVPLHRQQAFADSSSDVSLPVSEELAQRVISLPIHTEMDSDLVKTISDFVGEYFAGSTEGRLA